MYFTLAVSAVTPERCAGLTDRARITDPAVMPVPGPATVFWRSPDGRAALLRWGDAPGRPSPVSHAGTIWAGTPTPGSGRAPVYAKTTITRVDPVYVAELPGAIILSDRAMWAAWTANRLSDHDHLLVCALLNPGFPLGSMTPFRGVSALASSTTLHLLNGTLTRLSTPSLAPSPAPSMRAIAAAPDPARLRSPRSAQPGFPGPPHPASPGSAQPGFPGPASGSAGPTPGSADPAPGFPGSAPGSAGPAQQGFAGSAQPGFSDPDHPGFLGLAHPGSPRPASPASSPDVAPHSGHFRNAGHAAGVAAALVEAVAPLREAGRPVELSLTGGKDSRLVAAALVAAGVPVRARTHGFPDHPDVVIAAEVARRLGIPYDVRVPAAPGQKVDVIGRIRATVLVADGMLSAFENVGRPDPSVSPVITAGGHGGELLRGGYAEAAAGRRATALRSAELLRRLTTRHLGLLRRGAAASYVSSLAPWTAALARGPLSALDDFYLVNRAGRWSAAARQAYLIREDLVQPLFGEHVVAAARAVPLAARTSGELARAVLAELSPALVDVPLAGKAPAGSGPAPFDWRREYGAGIASFLCDYTMDLGAPGGLFDVVNRTAVERALNPPHKDRATVWAIATLACLLSGDYRHAREPAQLLPVT